MKKWGKKVKKAAKRWHVNYWIKLCLQGCTLPGWELMNPCDCFHPLNPHQSPRWDWGLKTTKGHALSPLFPAACKTEYYLERPTGKLRQKTRQGLALGSGQLWAKYAFSPPLMASFPHLVRPTWPQCCLSSPEGGEGAATCSFTATLCGPSSAPNGMLKVLAREPISTAGTGTAQPPAVGLAHPAAPVWCLGLSTCFF